MTLILAFYSKNDDTSEAAFEYPQSATLSSFSRDSQVGRRSGQRHRGPRRKIPGGLRSSQCGLGSGAVAATEHSRAVVARCGRVSRRELVSPAPGPGNSGNPDCPIRSLGPRWRISLDGSSGWPTRYQAGSRCLAQRRRYPRRFPRPANSSVSLPTLQNELRPLTGQQLRELAQHLTETHQVGPPSGKAQGLLRRLKANGQILEQVRESLDESARLLQPITPAAEWLLDNSYIIQGHIADIHRNLPRQYHKVLPVLTAKTSTSTSPPWRLSQYRLQRCRREVGPGTLRIYHLAVELIQGTDARFTRDLLIEFLQTYQQRAPVDDCRTLGLSSPASFCTCGGIGTPGTCSQPPSE